MAKINLFQPYSTEEEIKAVTEVIRSGWWKEGPKCLELEEKFSKYTGAKHSLTVISGTAGYDLLFKAYDIKDCDVIVPAMTFISTGIIPLYNNCNVIFADCKRDDLTIDPEDVERKITKNTKAIVLQHMSGIPCDMDAFKKFADAGIQIIEDAAHGSGCFYKGKHVGTEYPAMFSFNVVKNIASGEGGIITLPDTDKYERAKSLRWCGINQTTWERDGKKYKWDYSIDELGYKYHFNDILASIALVQFNRLEATNGIRRKLVHRYKLNLSHNKGITLPKQRNSDKPSWHQFIIRVNPDDRNPLLDHLGDNSIGCGVHYKPINMYPLWEHGDTPVTDEEWLRMVTLPLHPAMTIDDVDEVCRVIKEYYAESK
jgi:perosamine synthetase